MSGLNNSGAFGAVLVIGISIALMLGLNAFPNILHQNADVLVVTTGLERTLAQYLPVAIAILLFTISLGAGIYLTKKSLTGANGIDFIALLLAFITLIIAMGLILPVNSAQDAALVQAGIGVNGQGASVCGASRTLITDACSTPGTASGAAGSAGTVSGVFIGSKQFRASASYAASADAAAIKVLTDAAAASKRTADGVLNDWALNRTILGYVVIGFMINLLTATFGLANQGTGGALSRGIGKGYRRVRYGRSM